jgi:hypothetical protein
MAKEVEATEWMNWSESDSLESVAGAEPADGRAAHGRPQSV